MLNFNPSNIVSKSRTIGRRMFLISAVKGIVIFGVFARLVSLQITESNKYQSLSDRNRFREWKLAPPRGVIKDYFGKELATNEKIYQLHVTPENSDNIEGLFFKLKNILNLKEAKISSLKRKIKKQKPWEPIIISENLTWSEFSKINLYLHELPGAEPIVSVARVYLDDTFSHTLGYVSKVSVNDLKNKKYLRDLDISGISVGKSGLEAKLDKKIIGEVGFNRYEVNAYGKRIRQISTNSGKQGKNIRTTLDHEVQFLASNLLEDVSGSICVMDIHNGDIIAMASSPKFNPNSFVHGIKKSEWNDLLKNRDKPMTNKAISGLYPPGSTIKTIVALSALENDVASPDLKVRCDGYIDFYEEKFHCWKKKGHGLINMRNAIKKSCDVYFYEIARRLGVDRLAVTAKKFGLGKKALTGFFEERPGVVPDTKWKLKEIGKNWYLGETLISGIGQGYFLSTPLQLCLMTAQLANGGFKIRPRMLFDENNNVSGLKEFLNYKKENPDYADRVLIQNNFNPEPLFRNQENINFVKDAMFASTNEPGGTSYASRLTNKKFMFAGKTGSSQIKRFTQEQREAEVKQEDIDYLSRDHALFVAFAPYSDPKYAISVLVEHGGSGSRAAAPLAKKVIKKVLERDELRKLQKNLSGIES
jgi:penicillin-binding protein 2